MIDSHINGTHFVTVTLSFGRQNQKPKYSVDADNKPHYEPSNP